MSFFKLWKEQVLTKGHLAYDVRSFSSYTKSQIEVEYNRDGEKPPQINMGCYLSRETGLPIFYVTYPGSIIDKSHMPFMMAYNNELGIGDVIFVMGSVFGTKTNIQWLHSQETRYVLAIDRFHKITRAAVDQARDSLNSTRYQIDGNVFGRTIKSRFYGVKSDMHVFFDRDLADIQQAELYRHVVSKGETLEQLSKIYPKEVRAYARFYNIKINKDNSFDYSINSDNIDLINKYSGYFCILSNLQTDISEILEIYRKKDIIERNFYDIKNFTDMLILKTHNDETTNGKLFCAFIALIVFMKINEQLKKNQEATGKRPWSVEKLVMELEKIKVINFSDGTNLINPVTKKQREVLAKFGISENDLKSSILEACP
jgi:transposase